jgi:hypothetical protein
VSNSYIIVIKVTKIVDFIVVNTPKLSCKRLQVACSCKRSGYILANFYKWKNKVKYLIIIKQHGDLQLALQLGF